MNWNLDTARPIALGSRRRRDLKKQKKKNVTGYDINRETD